MKPQNLIPQLGIMFLFLLTTHQPTVAQIIPDTTLPNNSTVIPNNNILLIQGGSVAGSNLFHSFKEFSLPTNNIAVFNNNPEIQNILTRVTGGNISNIDGIIKANGTANLFFINPKGIIFGPNAALNIGGSFIGSTADRIKFADGSYFSATNTQTTPLLTINTPVGLQLGTNPGDIINQSRFSIPTLPVPIGLAVTPGQTLALVGGNLILQQSNISAPSGKIDLIAAGENSLVNLTTNSNNNNFLFGYEGVKNFRDIQLSNGAIVSSSGSGGGSILVSGRQISLTGGSSFLALTLENQPGGEIRVNATESLKITGLGGYENTVQKFVAGNVNFNDLRSGFFAVSLGSGSAGNIIINSPVFSAENASFLSTSTFGIGQGGNITLNSNNLEMSASFIATGSGVGKSGDAGNLTINTNNLKLINNAILTTSTIGFGRGGNITVNALDGIELKGENPFAIPGARVFTGFFSSSLGSGNAGDIRVNTRQLSIRSGAGIAASAFGQGDGGNITINAGEKVEIKGTSPNGQALSSITAVTEPISTGKGGNLIVNTPKLILEDGGRLSVRSRGSGRTGNLEINADFVSFNNAGGIEGTAVAGEGADLNVNTRILQLRNNSFISATAGTEGGPGNGGNIMIDTDTLALLDNSSIVANAFSGKGGNIKILAQGNFISPDSKITASSQLGVSGVIEIRTPDSNPSLVLIELPQNFADVSGLISSSCDKIQGNEFIITGRGGFPQNPSQTLPGNTIWNDMRSLAINANTSLKKIENTKTSNLPITEANQWKTNDKGSIELIAKSPDANSQSSWYQSAQCGNYRQQEITVNK